MTSSPAGWLGPRLSVTPDRLLGTSPGPVVPTLVARNYSSVARLSVCVAHSVRVTKRRSCFGRTAFFGVLSGKLERVQPVGKKKSRVDDAFLCQLVV